MEKHDPERWLHCWEPGPWTEDGCSTVCLLREGHEGPHEFLRGDRVSVSFDADHNATGTVKPTH